MGQLVIRNGGNFGVAKLLKTVFSKMQQGLAVIIT